MLVISSRISGWRVTDSITFPKMYPTPMPGPIAAEAGAYAERDGLQPLGGIGLVGGLRNLENG